MNPSLRLALSVAVALAVLMSFSACAQAQAQDYFLTIGGGPTATSNEASIESNLHYVQGLLDEAGVSQERRHVLFADGGDSSYADVQYADAESQGTPLTETLALLHNSLQQSRYQYRPSDVPNVAGPSNIESIDRWFDEHAEALDGDDRLIVYFTGHGSRGTDEQPRQTTMALWGPSQIRVAAFTERLDRLHPDVEVVLVMVQCHSGGFADVIFQGSDPEAGLNPHRRVGFFAAPIDRMAAGCTPEIDEANYADYSTYFFAAALGKDRLGEPVTDGDLDGDGRVSLAEAHAYVVVNADTIDVPMTTSDAFLRQYSRLPESAEDEHLLDTVGNYEQLCESAEPHQLAVLEGLSETLELDRSDRIVHAREAIEAIRHERHQIGQEVGEKRKRFNQSRHHLSRDLFRRWPQLNYRWNPHVDDLLEQQGEEIYAFVQAHGAHDSIWKIHEEVMALNDRNRALERKSAMHDRLIYTAETVALAANLPHVADEAHVARYHQLLEMESRSLLSPR